MKNQFIILFSMMIISSLQDLSAQEAPRLAHSAQGPKAEENKTEATQSKPVMTVWAKHPVPAQNKNSEIKGVPELAIQKKEKQEVITEE